MGTHARHSGYIADASYADADDWINVISNVNPDIRTGHTSDGTKRRPEPAHASTTRFARRDKIGAHADPFSYPDATFDTPPGKPYTDIDTDPTIRTVGYTANGSRRHGKKKHALTWKDTNV